MKRNSNDKKKSSNVKLKVQTQKLKIQKLIKCSNSCKNKSKYLRNKYEFDKRNLVQYLI